MVCEPHLHCGEVERLLLDRLELDDVGVGGHKTVTEPVGAKRIRSVLFNRVVGVGGVERTEKWGVVNSQDSTLIRVHKVLDLSAALAGRCLVIDVAGSNVRQSRGSAASQSDD